MISTPVQTAPTTSHDERVFRFAVFSNFAVHIIFSDDLYDSAMKIAIRDCHNAPSDGLHDIDACQIDTLHSSYLYFKPTVSIGTMAHESWHTVHAMLRAVGAGLDDEVVAYHLGYTVDQVVNFKLDLDRKKNECQNARGSSPLTSTGGTRGPGTLPVDGGAKVRRRAKVRSTRSGSRSQD
jgi:hypothetical protein